MAVPRRAVRARRGLDAAVDDSTPAPAAVIAARRKPRPLTAVELSDVPVSATPTRLDVIRAVARRHFAEHGYDAASMREIAADASSIAVLTRPRPAPARPAKAWAISSHSRACGPSATRSVSSTCRRCTTTRQKSRRRATYAIACRGSPQVHASPPGP